MTSPDYKAIGRHVSDLARAADEDLAGSVEREIIRTARNDAAKLFGQMDINDKSNCGRLTMLFKDKAQPDYGVLSIQFDRKGNILMSEAHDAGSEVARGVIEDMKNGESGAKISADISAGRNVISQITPTCKL